MTTISAETQSAPGLLPDADKLHRRLIRLLERSRADATYRYPNPSELGLRRDAELEALRRGLDLLAKEIHVYTAAGLAMLERLKSVSPAVEWVIRAGVFRGTVREDSREAVHVAHVLRLHDDRRPTLGARRWIGEVEGWRVSLAFIQEGER